LLLQLTRWLQDEHWTPMPLRTAFIWATLEATSGPIAEAFLQWNVHPASWLGVHTFEGCWCPKDG
jgi:hypothetical protein